MALHCKTPTLARLHGRSIVPNRSDPKATAASKTKQPKTEDTDASASDRAIGDNGSTLEDTDAFASDRAIGDNGSTMEDTDYCPLDSSSIRSCDCLANS